MQFTVLPVGTRNIPAEPGAYLVDDNWDDFKYKTLFWLHIVDKNGKHEIGTVRIAAYGMTEGTRTILPQTFEYLHEGYYSVGSDVSYYENLQSLNEISGASIYRALRDVAYDRNILSKVRNQAAFKTSLLRDTQIRTVEEQYYRISHGGTVNTPYEFRYITPRNSFGQSSYLDFSMTPNSQPPTNIHALIGSNGVGKTYILSRLGRAVVDTTSAIDTLGAVTDFSNRASSPFANVVSLSFSAFDPSNLIRYSTEIPFNHIGLYEPTLEKDSPRLRTNKKLGEVFQSSAYSFTGVTLNRWHEALRTLQTDPIFAMVYNYATSVNHLADHDVTPSSVFEYLSSGHKAVLLSITKLVELVTERTLVLIDEPETHLHPPLLSAFIRVVSDLLTNRNGVAVIATHSPVVLQETPKSCVQKIRRSGDVIAIERPEIETFGENVGVLTREAFGLEVTRSGFHQLISDAVNEGLDFEEIMFKFRDQLGSEAMGIARALIAIRNRDR